MEFSEVLEQVPPFPPGGGELVNRERGEEKRDRKLGEGTFWRKQWERKILDEAVGEATLRGEDWERTDRVNGLE